MHICNGGDRLSYSQSEKTAALDHRPAFPWVRMGKYHITSYVIGVIHSTPLRDTTHPDARLNLPIADTRKVSYPTLDFHDVYYPT